MEIIKLVKHIEDHTTNYDDMYNMRISEFLEKT